MPGRSVRCCVASRGALPDPASAAIASSVTTLMHQLGLAVVAEGIETDEQRQFLVESGCFRGQGHHFAEAMPAPAVAGWLRSWPSG